MKTMFLALIALGTLTTQAFAIERKAIVIKADTDYKQTVWSAVGLPRTYSANVLPASPQAADVLSRLNHRNTYRCEADFYLGSIGNFNRDGEKAVVMLYNVYGCQTQ